jgi:hypothetical protein
MGFLRLLAWLVILVIVLGLASSLLPPTQRAGGPGPSLAGGGLAWTPSAIAGSPCPQSNTTIVLDPSVFYGRYFNLTEALEELSSYSDPLTYYGVYANITAALASPSGAGRVYALHALPLDEKDSTGLGNMTVYVCTPGSITPPGVEPALVSDTSVRYVNGSVVDIATYAPTARLDVSLGFRPLGLIIVADVMLEGARPLTGIASTMNIIVAGRSHRVNETGVIYSFIPEPGEQSLRIPVYISDEVSICGGRCINITRRLLLGYLVVNTTLEGDRVGGEAWVEYAYPAEIASLNLEEIKRALASRPAGRILEELALEYVHDRLVEIVNSTAMRQYPGAYLWLLASQIPIGMGSCSPHNSSTPLLDALCGGCGSDWERVWILGNITRFTLEVATATGLVKWPSLTSETIVETPIVYANITGYPELWQLYNETLGIHLAKPLDGKYQVYYDPVENTAFCDWDRLVETI